MITTHLPSGRRINVFFQHEQYFVPALVVNKKGLVELGKVPVPQPIPATDNAFARGLTRCIVTEGERGYEVVIATGTAYCSWEDNFSKAMGREISLRRALWGAGLDNDDFDLIIQSYNNRTVGTQPATTKMTLDLETAST